MARLPRLPFTATRAQVATYLLGVALFSISFLVFLNGSVSFVITDLIGQRERVGDAVGTLGFADELLALLACPAWGLLSDRVGVRHVCALGYALVGLALVVFVQARNVYPQLLLARLLFSFGGAATATMVTAILPTMSLPARPRGRPHSSSVSTAGTDATLTQDSHAAHRERRRPAGSGTSQAAGLVGMFTGLGALVALGLFLPLPAHLRAAAGEEPAAAVAHSFYIVGAVALLVAVLCFVGLRGLPGEEGKGFGRLAAVARSHVAGPASPAAGAPKADPLLRLAWLAVKLAVTDVDIGLGYLGGFVARASSVAISLFIPLYVNAHFISTGKCQRSPGSAPSEGQEHECQRAYKLAAALTGVTQLVALVAAPVFGLVDGRCRRFHAPLLVAALFGVVGYGLLGRATPDPGAGEGGAAIFALLAMLGLSQIGAIVCSLSMLGRGIQGGDDEPARHDAGRGRGQQAEAEPLLAPLPDAGVRSTSHSQLKGSIAGVYSLAGGAGILLLTKLGGFLFDELSPGAPFFIMSAANALLFAVGLACGVGGELRPRAQAPSA